jgi:hypothetical protein
MIPLGMSPLAVNGSRNIDKAGAKGIVDHLPKRRRRIHTVSRRAGVVEFLDRDNVRLQPLEDVQTRCQITLVVPGR